MFFVVLDFLGHFSFTKTKTLMCLFTIELLSVDIGDIVSLPATAYGAKKDSTDRPWLRSNVRCDTELGSAAED